MAINIDQGRIDLDANIEEDTTLFKITRQSYSGKRSLLTGKGALSEPGRLHRKGQLTSYASDNFLLCIAEMLYHLSCKLIRNLVNSGTAKTWRQNCTTTKQLVVFRTTEIRDLAYLDTQDCRYHLPVKALHSSVIVNPIQVYEPLQAASAELRKQNMVGVICPSARHSQGHVIALFENHTNSIKKIVARLRIKLSLIDEIKWKPADSSHFDPYSDMISHAQGHFEINPDDFKSFQKKHAALSQPQVTKNVGDIDFLRRHYRTYPHEAIL